LCIERNAQTQKQNQSGDIPQRQRLFFHEVLRKIFKTQSTSLRWQQPACQRSPDGP
jgi:hypothetical protein